MEEEEKKEEKKEDKQEGTYKVVEVTTETGLAISSPEGKVLNQLDLLVEMANDLREVKKAVAD